MASNLEAELQSKRTRYGKTGMRMWQASEGAFWLSVVTSVLASAAGQIPWFTPITVSALAAAPALLLLIGEKAAFLPRANWHFEYEAKLNGLIRELRDQNIPVADVSRRLSALEEDMTRRFPGRAEKNSAK